MSDARIDTATQSYNHFSNDPYVFDAQTSLNNIYGEGTVKTSGYLDANTESALKQFQRDVGLPQTGRPDGKTLDALNTYANTPSETAQSTQARAQASRQEASTRGAAQRAKADKEFAYADANSTSARVGLLDKKGENYEAQIYAGEITVDPEQGKLAAKATKTSFALKTSDDAFKAQLDLLTAEAHSDLYKSHGMRGFRVGGSAALINVALDAKNGSEGAQVSWDLGGVGANAGVWVQDEDADGRPEICFEGKLSFVSSIWPETKGCKEVHTLGIPGLDEQLQRESLANKTSGE